MEVILYPYKQFSPPLSQTTSGEGCWCWKRKKVEAIRKYPCKFSSQSDGRKSSPTLRYRESLMGPSTHEEERQLFELLSNWLCLSCTLFQSLLWTVLMMLPPFAEPLELSGSYLFAASAQLELAVTLSYRHHSFLQHLAPFCPCTACTDH